MDYNKIISLIVSLLIGISLGKYFSINCMTPTNIVLR